MFVAIDNFVTYAVRTSPEVSDTLDREAIKNAVVATMKYEKELKKRIEEAK